MIKTLIVDDEPLSCSKIKRLLQEDSDIEVMGECNSGKDAVRAIQEKKPDLLFLDVQMPEMDGFEVLQALGDGRLPVVVFVTAYDRYALQAFEFYPVDYLLKPFASARFQKALRQAKDQVTRGLEGDLRELIREAQQKPRYLERLTVRSTGRVFFLSISSVEWIEAEGRYCLVHVGKESHPLRESLLTLESQLDPNKFFRINRSTLVNSDQIRELQQMFHGDYQVILLSGKNLTLSRRYRNRVEELFSHR